MAKTEYTLRIIKEKDEECWHVSLNYAVKHVDLSYGEHRLDYHVTADFTIAMDVGKQFVWNYEAGVYNHIISKLS